MADTLSSLLAIILTLRFRSTLKSILNPLPPMPNIPSELLTEIFSRLPVQSLLRFRSTSKSLKSLIDSHYFINLHLKNSLNFNLILSQRSEFYQIDFPNLTTTVSVNHPLTPCCSSEITFLGSCNGFLCIFNGCKEIALWNPNISKHRFIPYPPFSQRSAWASFVVVVYGFAFNPVANDYKLLRISSSIDLTSNFFDSQVTLFSSKTNLWKVLPNMPYAVFSARDTGGVFVENSLHWDVIRTLEKCDQPALIVAFNLTQEIFNEVPLPEILASTTKSFDLGVSVLGDCLCMIVSYPILNYKNTKFDVWVMKEYGLKQSWCKLFTLWESFFYTHLLSLKPLSYSSNRSKVLLEVECKKLRDDLTSDCRKLFWYDLKSEKATCVRGIPNFNEAMIYVGNLLPPSLSIDDYNYRKEKAQVEMQKKTQEKVKLNHPPCTKTEIEKKLRKNKTGCSSCLW